MEVILQVGGDVQPCDNSSFVDVPVSFNFEFNSFLKEMSDINCPRYTERIICPLCCCKSFPELSSPQWIAKRSQRTLLCRTKPICLPEGNNGVGGDTLVHPPTINSIAHSLYAASV